jgi:SOS-response transcriptional repressor LexA
MFNYFNGYWNWAGENPAHNNPTSTAIYFYIVSIANQLGWKPEFSLSSTQVMNGCGIANYKTYKKHLDILIENGLIKIVRESKNQYMANVFALVNFTEALPKHSQSSTEALPKQVQSTAHIHKTIKTIKTYKSIDEIKKEHFADEKINSLFIQFLSERIARKKYPTDNAIQLLIKQMRKIYKTKEEVIEGLELAIANGWTGLYELNKNNSKQPANAAPTKTRASMGVKME